MTNEEKQLLLKDLTARLPYNVKVAVVDIDGKILKRPVGLFRGGWYEEYGEVLFITSYYGTAHKAEEIRPYLRPMSSMTDEEKKEFIKYSEYEVEESVNGRHYEYYLKDYVGTQDKPDCNYNAMDWLLEHHFDFRGLIEKGLALEAPEGMYN